MINGKRVAVVMPAYNAEKTLEATVHELPDLVDIRILVDDHSSDRIVGGAALRGGMPLYKYIANRFLTAFENIFLRVKLSEYHTGYRAFSRKVLTELPLLENSDDFVFDNQTLAQCVYFGFRIGEVSCPTKYFEEASSINFSRSVNYGLGVLGTTLQFALQKSGFGRFRRFSPQGRTLDL